MGDRKELTNDPEEAMRAALDGRQAQIWTALPGFITEVQFDKNTVSVQPTIQGTVQNADGSSESVNLPLLLDVPVCFPSGGGFSVTFPLAVNDEVLVIFASRCIDAWWQNSGIQKPMEMRMHDLSDGFAIPGPKSVPNAISSISSTEIQFRNGAGTTYLSITPAGKIGFQNATTDLKGILTDFETAVNNFMVTLAAFAGGGAPVTQAMLQAPAATAVAALTPVLAKIGALLK